MVWFIHGREECEVCGDAICDGSSFFDSLVFESVIIIWVVELS